MPAIFEMLYLTACKPCILTAVASSTHQPYSARCKIHQVGGAALERGAMTGAP